MLKTHHCRTSAKYNTYVRLIVLHLFCTKLLVAQKTNFLFDFGIETIVVLAVYSLFHRSCIFFIRISHIRVNNAIRKCNDTANSKIKRVRLGHLC